MAALCASCRGPAPASASSATLRRHALAGGCGVQGTGCAVQGMGHARASQLASQRRLHNKWWPQGHVKPAGARMLDGMRALVPSRECWWLQVDVGSPHDGQWHGASHEKLAWAMPVHHKTHATAGWHCLGQPVPSGVGTQTAPVQPGSKGLARLFHQGLTCASPGGPLGGRWQTLTAGPRPSASGPASPGSCARRTPTAQTAASVSLQAQLQMNTAAGRQQATVCSTPSRARLCPGCAGA